MAMEVYNDCSEIGWCNQEVNGQKIRGRANGFERYLPGHGRVKSEGCEHTQIADTPSMSSHWCLDCGYLTDPRGLILEYLSPLTDPELIEKRIEFNDRWFDKTYKLYMDDPDDPNRDAEVDAALEAEGIERLT